MNHRVIVLLTGAGGQLGRELQKRVPQSVHLYAMDSQNLDVTDMQAVHSVIERISPDVVINAAAYTAVDKAEVETEKAFSVNANAPRYIAEACKHHSCRIIQVSTDFVFDGYKSFPYSPNDAVKPLNTYGASKLSGEINLLKVAPLNSLIIRTSWLYSAYGKNFVKTMLRLMSERNEISVVDDQVGTPTYAAGLADIIWRFVLSDVKSGIYHWSDAGVASWYDFAVAIMEEGLAAGLIDREIKITPVASTEYAVLAERPKYSVLNKDSLRSRFSIMPTHWRVNLRKMILAIS